MSLQTLACTQLVVGPVSTCRPLNRISQSTAQCTLGSGHKASLSCKIVLLAPTAALTLGLRVRSCTLGLVFEGLCVADWLWLAALFGSAQLDMRRWDARSEGP